MCALNGVHMSTAGQVSVVDRNHCIIVLNHCIMDHYGRNNLIKQSQHGFMPEKSCLSNLLLFQEAITSDIIILMLVNPLM